MDCKSCPYKRECHELPSDLSCKDVFEIMKHEPKESEHENSAGIIIDSSLGCSHCYWSLHWNSAL